MFLGHTYQIKSEMRLSGGDIVKIRTTIEARFVDSVQPMIELLKERIEFETDERVVEVLSFKMV